MRKLLFVLCCAALLLSLFGCGRSPGAGPSGSGAGESTASPSRPDAQALSLLTAGRLNCAGDGGYYYLSNQGQRLRDGGYAFHMMYLDYGSLREIYLCNRPGCGHDSAECPSVFLQDEARPGGSLFLYGGALYLFSHDQDQDGSSHVSTEGAMQAGEGGVSGAPACLIRMNPDGTGRERVFTFDAGLFVEDVVLGGSRSLYFVTKKLSSGQLDGSLTYYTSTERTLVRVDTGDWRQTAVCALDPDWKIIGAWENNLVVSQVLFSRELSPEERYDEQAYRSAYQDSTTRLSLLDPADGTPHPLLTLSNQNLNSFAVADGTLYHSTEGEGQILRLDLGTEEDTVLAETGDSQILSVHREALLCSSWGEADQRTFVHLDDGRQTPCGLTTASMGTPVEIRGEGEDSFLVIYDVDAKRDTAYNNGQYSVYGYKYALIKKEALYQGRAEYRPFEMIGFGE